MVVGGWDELLDRPKQASIGGGGKRGGRQQQGKEWARNWAMEKAGKHLGKRERHKQQQQRAARLLPRWSVRQGEE